MAYTKETCGVTEKAVIGLDLRLGLKPRKFEWGHTPSRAIELKISHGKSNAPLQSVRTVTCYSLFWEGAANAARKELHESSGKPVKADGHSFSE